MSGEECVFVVPPSNHDIRDALCRIHNKPRHVCLERRVAELEAERDWMALRMNTALIPGGGVSWESLRPEEREAYIRERNVPMWRDDPRFAASVPTPLSIDSPTILGCPKCGERWGPEGTANPHECPGLSELEKLAKEQGVEPYDPAKPPDWEPPSKEEADAYLKAMKLKPGSVSPGQREGAKPQRVYLASRYERKEELKRHRMTFLTKGIEVTSRWLDSEQRPSFDSPEIEPFLTKWAIFDEEDIKRADVLVLFTHGEGGTGGMHVEYGIARSLGKRLIIVGPWVNAFHFLPGVKRYVTFEDALNALVDEPPHTAPKQEEKCERCGGSGEATFGGLDLVGRKCPDCHGTGKKRISPKDYSDRAWDGASWGELEREDKTLRAIVGKCHKCQAGMYREDGTGLHRCYACRKLVDECTCEEKVK